MTIKDNALKEKLTYLAKLEDTSFPFVSVYLNINAKNFLENKEENRIFIKNAYQKAFENIKNSQNKKSLLNDLERIKKYIDEQVEPIFHGVAIFACEQMGVWETFKSYASFENSFNIDYFPHLKQLAYQLDEYENTLVAMFDSNYSKIFSLKLGGFISDEIEIISDVHKFHKQGGWSQLRYQRGIETEKLWHYKDTAEELTKLFDKEQCDNIILIGKTYEIESLKNLLPKRLLGRIINEDNLAIEANINLILEKIAENLYENETKKELYTVNNIIDKTQSKDGASIGVEETMELAQEGRINTLTVLNTLNQKGYKCGNCLFSQKDQYKSGCPKCNGGTLKTDLIEETIRMTIKNGGIIEFLKPETEAGEELSKHEGIGALLRY